jgi:hypothetical protein
VNNGGILKLRREVVRMTATDTAYQQARGRCQDLIASLQLPGQYDGGHGFTSRDNDVKAHTLIAEFLEERLR